MVLWVYRHDKNAPCHGEERICYLRMLPIGYLGKRSDIDKFATSWATLVAVKMETVLFKEVYEPLLLDSFIENRDVYLANLEAKGVIENDLKKPFSKTEAVQRYFETADFQALLL